MFCNFKSSKEKNLIFKIEIEILNYMKDSLERKIASVAASIEVLENKFKEIQRKQAINIKQSFQGVFQVQIFLSI